MTRISPLCLPAVLLDRQEDQGGGFFVRLDRVPTKPCQVLICDSIMLVVVTFCQASVYIFSMPQPRKNPQKPLASTTKTVAERLRSLRRQKGLTQAQVAELVGITRESIAAYETGRVRLVDDMVVRFALALGVSADVLLGISGVPVEEGSTLRIIRRVKKIEQLPPAEQKALLRTIDMAIRDTDK